MTQKKLYTVGCSLTRYHWPTWADILGQSFDHFENWGNRGAGNKQILERFSELIIKNELTEKDTVVVQWTNYHRFDQHQWDSTLDESWYPAGHVFQEGRNDPRTIVIQQMWNEQSYIMHTWNYIHAGIGLANTTSAKVIFVFGDDLRYDLDTEEFFYYTKLLDNEIFVDKDMFNWTTRHYDNRMSFYNADPNSNDSNKTPDYHPTPIMYYNWLNEFIGPKLGIDIDVEFATKMQTAVETVDDYNKIAPAIHKAGYDTNKYWKRGY
jgi:hypothetical protein